jgi:hypothetical protein
MLQMQFLKTNSNGLDKQVWRACSLWTTPRKDLLRYFLRTLEAMEDGRLLGQVRGQEILIDQIFIHE